MKKVMIKIIVLFTGLLLHVGCNSDTIVANDRTQAQAVELVAILNSNGISAGTQPKRGSQDRYSVQVPSRYYNQAIALVHRFGLAGDPEPSFSELLSNGSFLPASRAVESFKLDLALAALVEQTLKTLSDVQSAKVVIRRNSSADNQAASGSIVVLLKPNATTNEESIKQVIAAALPEIDANNLAIKLSEGRPASAQLLVQGVDNNNHTLVNLPLRDFVYWKVPEGEFNGLAWFLIGILAVTAFIFASIGFLLAYLKYNRAVVDPQFGEPGLLGMAATEKPVLKKTNGQ